MKFLKCVQPFYFSIQYIDEYVQGGSIKSHQANINDLFDCDMTDPWVYLDDDGDGNIYLHRYREFLEEVELTMEEREEHLKNTSCKIWWQG